MKIVGARSWSVSSVQLVAALAYLSRLFATLDIANAILSPGSFAQRWWLRCLLKPPKD